ncbi:Eisosome component PIL1-domain-containing protein [Lipomyces arxii]|uniref:Eisosome component PIL1-domain-containing protein n=1 Tax=Lipomyces arxii TaxID=56418 RepID=UPI0034CF345B
MSVAVQLLRMWNKRSRSFVYCNFSVHRALSLRSHTNDNQPGSPLAATTLSLSRPTSPRKFLPQSWDQPLGKLIKSWGPVAAHHRSAALSCRSTAHSLSSWGDQTGDDAVSDVADKFGVLLAEMANIEELYSEELEEIKRIFRTIQDVENSIRPAKSHHTKLRDQINKASIKPDPGRKLEQLEREFVRSEAEVLVADAQLFNVTREQLRIACRAQLDALQERCEKELVLVKYGHEITKFLDGDVVVPGQNLCEYRGDTKTREILGLVDAELKRWCPGTYEDLEESDHEDENAAIGHSAAATTAATSASVTASMILRK